MQHEPDDLEGKLVPSSQPGEFRIFLSYRRGPNAAHAGRLHDSLTAGVDEHPGFAADQIFMDIDTIAPGDDFREAIADAVAKCDVFLALIGKQWATIRDGRRGRRLDNPGDYVRLELEAALERKIPVVPVLVDGAKMPSEEDLPKSVSPVVYRQAVELTNTRWRDDVGRLLASLKTREQASRPKKPQASRAKKPQAIRPTKPRARTPSPKGQGLPPLHAFMKPSPQEQGVPPVDAFMNAHNIGDVVDGTVKTIFEKSASVELAPNVQGMLYGERVFSFGPERLKTADGRIVSSGKTVRVKIERRSRLDDLTLFPIALSLA